MQSKDRPSGRGFVEQARRAQFVECAIEALADVGFPGTSIAEVARRAGVAKSVVLYHFVSKDALLTAVVEDVYQRAGQDLVHSMETATTAGQRLDRYLRGCVAFAWEHRDRCHAVAEVFRSLRDAEGRPRFPAARNAELVDFVRGLLTDGQRTGEFGAFDAHALAVLIRAGIDALPSTFDAEPELDGPTFADQFVTIVAAVTRPPG